MDDELYNRTVELQTRMQQRLDLPAFPWDLSAEQKQQLTKEHVLAGIVEATEVLDQVNWKPWKAAKQVNKPHLQEEVVDLMHFTMNLVVLWFDSWDEFMQMYRIKNDENHRRQDRGY